MTILPIESLNVLFCVSIVFRLRFCRGRVERNCGHHCPCSDESALGKTMVSVDKKTKIFPASKNEAAVKKETAPKKKDEGQPKDKSTSDADLSKAEGGEKAADSPSVYSRGEGQKTGFESL